jgi:hypothetical protein
VGSGLSSFGAVSNPSGLTGGFATGTGALDLSGVATGTGLGNVNAFGNGMNFGGGTAQAFNIFGTAGGAAAGAGTGAALGTGTIANGAFSVTGTANNDFSNFGQGSFGGGPTTLTFGLP